MHGKNLSVVIIGAGMAGLLSAIRLKRDGFTNVCIYEKGNDVGGTWRDNTYPGLTCDTPSHSYTYSFAPNPDWSSYLVPGPEILAYLKKNVTEYQIENLIHFNQEIQQCIFDGRQWRLISSSGLERFADVVIAATGVLHQPNVPKIEGQQSFAGHLFHSARWDHSVELADKRVAVIGNGSTGVQLISKLVHSAGQVSHFQRSPQWIMPVENEPYSQLQRDAFASDSELLKREQNDPVLNGRIDAFSEAIVNPSGPEMQEIEEVVAAYLEASIADSTLKQQLTPDYQAACKRLIFSTDYYQAIQQPNARLVREGIEKIESKGIRTQDGELHEVDVIVYATGFKAHEFMRPMSVLGQDGVSLEQLWRDRPSAYLSIAMPKFPNFFMLNGPNGPVGNFSLTEIAEAQQVYLEKILAQMVKGEFSHIAVKKSAFDDFNARLIAAAKTTIFASGCQSWYLDKEGVPATWPWTRSHFKKVMSEPKWADFDTWTNEV